TFTSKITTPTGSKLTPTEVKLLRVNARGAVTGNLGSMHDDGANGDAVASDQVFTLKFKVTESCSGEMRVRVEASFQGQKKSILSEVAVIRIGSANAAPLVNAGADQTIESATRASLSGTASDDGLPSG